MATAASHELSDVELAAWRGFLTTHAELVRVLDAQLEAEHALPLSSYDVLIQLLHAPEGRLRMAELAERALLSRSGMTRLVDRLEADGLLSRQRCAQDKRGSFACLTERGRAVLERARPTHLDAVRARFLRHFSDDELATMTRFWTRVDLSRID